MKRYRNLWDELVEFRNLVDAAQRAGRGKRGLANVSRFHFDLERQLCDLQDELISQTATLVAEEKGLMRPSHSVSVGHAAAGLF